MDEFIKVLKAALLKGGLKEDSSEFLSIIKPDNFQGVLDKLKADTEITLPTTLEEALKLPGIQSLYDKKITEAVQKRETNLKEQWDFVEKGKGPTPETDEQKRIKALEEKYKVDEAAKILNAKKTNAINILKEMKIPDAFVNHFDFNSETELAEQAKSIETTFTGIKQAIINADVGGKLPTGGGENGKPSVDEARQLVERM